MAQIYIVVFLSFMALSNLAGAVEIEVEKISEKDVTFKLENKALKYTNIIGEMDGSYRELIRIDSKPSLYSAADGENYYTLKVKENNIYIDCLYSDFRSSTNGLRVRRGVCGLNKILDSEYVDWAFEYTNAWQAETSKMDTTSLLEKKEPIEISANQGPNIKVKQIYSKLSDLENSTPNYVIEAAGKCYSQGKINLYVVNRKQNPEENPIFLIIEPTGNEFKTHNLSSENYIKKSTPCSKTAEINK
ncbi:hypothetical protein QKY98_04460 [Pseudomonas sp. HR1]|uniref:Uncharacterized protein n=2 Tax=cellular organisms TaxID=131567 RepID=A0A1G5MKS7_9PSED|nr:MULTISPECIES: hypothetical protein [Pseudomonas]MDK4198364.1 hypothetical protein [Pseudomonas sp. HR1]NMY88134.1 hypothetical protein [Pseudomonas psychrotolerans]SCZ25763.1 hypothetical protein SAMN05216279_102240 [Pseudomonas psychrotolerans]